MLGLMQDWPLLCHRIIDHAAIQHPDRPVVSRSVEGPIHTTNYAEVRKRALKVAQRLDRDGMRLGDRVATLGWNTWRHIEAWYGILGIGAIYHTVNPRLFPEQIVWIVNHAEDRMMMTDLTFVPLLEKLADKLPSIERYVIFTDAAHMPKTTLKNAVPYEEWIAEVDGDFAWRSFDENTAAGMCYTSGTTGNPKGVLYSHRSNVLHAFMASLPDAKNIAARDVVLPVVPLFHANCWSLAFSTPLTGASLILPGPKLDGPSIYELLDLLVAGADVVPEFGQREKLVETGRLLVGGSASIFACGAARLGLAVALVATVGDDAFGSFMLDSVGERGVDTSGCPVVAGADTGLTVALVRDGDRAMLDRAGGDPAADRRDGAAGAGGLCPARARRLLPPAGRAAPGPAGAGRRGACVGCDGVREPAGGGGR